MFSRFFIDRPIFAAVLSIVITLAGGVAAFSLPIAQYPPITPPTIRVQCVYPGASAQVVAETVAAPIEQQVNGVENMLYMSSQSANDGSYDLSVTFEPGVNLNFAQVLVQNRVNLAIPSLPDVVRQTGVTTRKRSPDILQLVSLYSPDGRYNQLYLSNYATIQLVDEVKRVEGVGDVFLFGQQDYSMRVWVDPQKLAVLGLSAGDVVKAIREQNIPVAAGQLGQPPIRDNQEFQFTVSTLGRLSDPGQFDDIILKATPGGRVVHLRDVGYTELGPKSQDISARLNGKPCTSLAVFQLPDANALDTADRVRAKMEDLKKSFPPGLTYEIAYDTTPFIRESVREVFNTLRDAVILVTLVVLLFLQNWRSALIPLVAVPVAIVGTFAAMAAIGFSLNNLTLFGLVLAIGIVVDDAIVVVEAVEHHIEHGLAPRDATIRAMNEVSGPVVAVALVLAAVFVPCAFISGITGQFFRQFALTIAVSTAISAFNSLTLSPALTAILLRPRDPALSRPLPRIAFALLGAWVGYELPGNWLPALLGRLGRWTGPRPHDLVVAHLPAFAPWAGLVIGLGLGWLVGDRFNRMLGAFFHWFNVSFRRATGGYTWTVGKALRGSVLVLGVYGGLLVLTYWGFHSLPLGYIPSQDMGNLRVSIQLPDSSSLERTRAVVDHLDKICHETKGISYTISVAGQSFVLQANGSNFGQVFVTLAPFDQRRDPKQSSTAIIAELIRRTNKEIPEATIAVFGPPPVNGLGTAGGFKFIVEDRGDLGLNNLQGQTDNLIAKSKQQPGLAGVFTVFRANSPQLFVNVNRDECATMGVPLGDVFNTLQVYLGSLYVNDVNLFGRTWQVNVQAQGQFRNRVEDVNLLKVRNNQGGMVPLGTVAGVREINGPLLLTRYNMYPAATINGNTAPGVSSGQGIELMQNLAKRELPRAMSFEWTEIAFIQLRSGNTAMIIFGLAVLLVFLVLAALYESWALPLAVILVVPMCLLGSLAGVAAANSDINIFTQIGFVVLVGLASKNAILIVEFAKLKHEDGMALDQATLEACRLRLRPILMTSFAFILGVLPLLVSVGAGSEMRRTLGTAVFSGMIGVTLFGIFLTPVFFFVIEWVGETGLFAWLRDPRSGTLAVWSVTLIGFCLVGGILVYLGLTGTIHTGV
ncbi:MAG: efflux RND transporter permease subunit, partial [Planctomycetes bacterium]|nr:efflux RND transporter permease subunit [Planctomycetota bacterium]